MDKYKVLKDTFGHREFRQGQEEMVEAILAGKDVMGIMPTGAGKSICYQLPALMLEGITVVVSPLISLMKDQVMGLVQLGIRAAYINSSLTMAQYNEVFRRAYMGAYKIIYVAPERLTTDEFIRFSNAMKISMVTVDEAHCVSQWGQDFRPSYLKIAEYIKMLSCRPVVAAFTATATREVREDIISLLQLKDPVSITTGFDRKNLYFSVLKPKDKYIALKSILEENMGKSSIVYCLARKTVEEVCDKLNADGFSATRYHAGLDEGERHQNQDAFIFDKYDIMVATNAFGMGIDKSDVALVVHYNMPKNMESYYQEAGRAGRDGGEAQCILLYSGQDVRVNKFLIENSNENEELSQEMRERVRQRDMERLRDMTYYCTTNKCLREYMLGYFGEKSGSFCDNCSSCKAGFEAVDVTMEAQRIIACIRALADRGLSFGKMMIFDILRGDANERISRLHLNSLNVYGICGNVPDTRLRDVCGYLLENDYLAVNPQYSTLVLKDKAEKFIKSGGELIINLPKADKENTHYESKNQAVDMALFNELKALRLKLAAKIHVPAYVIFTDVTLRDMCRKQPTDYEGLLRVSGVGKVKADKYGKAFCKLIAAYIERKNKA